MVLIWLLMATIGCSTSDEHVGSPPKASKIAFDVALLDQNGLQGPPTGKRALAYEFCIPDTAACRDEVRSIDPTVQIQAGSPGRIGCGPGQNLCIGSTHQADFVAVLRALAARPYIERIQECFFE